MASLSQEFFDGGRWTGDGGRETVDGRRGTVDGRRGTVDGGRWTVDGGRWTVDGRRGTGRRETGRRGDGETGRRDLKAVYSSPMRLGAELALEAFKHKWRGKYDEITKSWRRNWDELMAFMDYTLRACGG